MYRQVCAYLPFSRLSGDTLDSRCTALPSSWTLSVHFLSKAIMSGAAQVMRRNGMEKIAVIFVILVALWVLIRLLLTPMKWGWKILIHGAGGVGCLWLLNLLSVWTGVYFPINPITALISGGLGVPGIALLAMVQMFL